MRKFLLCVILSGMGFAAIAAEEDEVTQALKAGTPAQVVKELTALSDKGNTRATILLSAFYMTGTNVPLNRVRACDLAESVAEKNPDGLEILGDCFFNGTGRPQDYVRSAAYYEKSRAAGHPKAACALGNQYRRGLGVQKDEAKARELCTESAAKGDADAQTDLGQMLLTGTGGPRDAAGAAVLFEKAVVQGQYNAMRLLGQMKWNGDGLAKDNELAGKLWLAAIPSRHPMLPTLLSDFYFSKAVDQAQQKLNVAEAVEAAMWAYTAAKVDPDTVRRAEYDKRHKMLIGTSPIVQTQVAQRVSKVQIDDTGRWSLLP